jgi:hypothetical protein
MLNLMPLKSESFSYELVISHDEWSASSRVFSEILMEKNEPLFEFQAGRVQLYNRKANQKARQYPFDPNRSALGSIPSMPGNPKLSKFKNLIREIQCVRIDAPRMVSRSERDSSRPNRDLSNFSSWYRRALVADAAAGSSFLLAIREVIDGMESLNLRELGQGIMELQTEFTRASGPARKSGGKSPRTYKLGFEELSDGQRTLIGLYALLYFTLNEHSTVCIDEPDNFLALAEIQPWLFTIQDRINNVGGQVILASHHPEILNMLAPGCGILFERENAGPTNAHIYSADSGSGLTPADRVARGWERG